MICESLTNCCTWRQSVFQKRTFYLGKMKMITITDVSFRNESTFRRQKGRMTFLAGLDSFGKNGTEVHLIEAETSVLSDGVEESMRLRVVLADAQDVSLRTDWECHAVRFMRNVWMVDCNSLSVHLRDVTFTKCSDKRLSIDLSALRQMVWLTPDGELREEIGSVQSDMMRWIETSCMVADCLIKRMPSDRLCECLRSYWLDLLPTEESVLFKMKK